MENRFEICCFDSQLIGTSSECDRLSCEGKHTPVFNLYYHKGNNEYCYCLNRDLLRQYWQCVIEDRNRVFVLKDAINAINAIIYIRS